MLRTVSCFLLLTFVAGCANPWASGYEKNPLLVQQELHRVEQTHIQLLQFEKLQAYARSEIALKLAPDPLADPNTQSMQRRSPAERLNATLGLSGQSAHLIGWSQFTNWELLNSDEPRLTQLAKHLGANQVMLASEYFYKTKYDINRPMTAYLNSVSPPPTPHGLFSHKPLPSLWWKANGLADRYFYTVIFLRNDSLPR